MCFCCCPTKISQLSIALNITLLEHFLAGQSQTNQLKNVLLYHVFSLNYENMLISLVTLQSFHITYHIVLPKLKLVILKTPFLQFVSYCDKVGMKLCQCFLLYCDVYPSEMASQMRENVVIDCPSVIDWIVVVC